MEKQNHNAAPTAQLTSVVLNLFRGEQARPIEAADLLPFKPKRHYIELSEAESEAALDRIFGAYVKRSEVGNGH